MAQQQIGKEIRAEETEIKPNHYTSHVLVGALAVMSIAFAMNETGVFQVSKTPMRSAFVITLLLFLALRVLAFRRDWITWPGTKYVIMSAVLVMILTLTVLLNIHAVLAFVVPILLATQYRSHTLSRMALIGACVCCGVSPILFYLLGTWSLNFLTGLLETFCSVHIEATPAADTELWTDIGRISLYWSLPQVLTLLAFGVILFSVTKAGIAGVENQIRVVDLSGDLNCQLARNLSMQEHMLCSMSDIIESRDNETGGHVRRTSQIVRLLTDAMRSDPDSEVSDEFCDNVIKAAPMHDLGKIAIPDTILRKPGRLTPEEYDIVKLHPLKSAEIIGQLLSGTQNDHLLITAKNLAKYHHERMDGEGYPAHLKGEEIPLEARIMAIADVYDALVSQRCYKAPYSPEEAFAIMEDSMGAQFDPQLNRYFLSCRQKIEAFYRN